MIFLEGSNVAFLNIFNVYNYTILAFQSLSDVDIQLLNYLFLSIDCSSSTLATIPTQQQNNTGVKLLIK